MKDILKAQTVIERIHFTEIYQAVAILLCQCSKHYFYLWYQTLKYVSDTLLIGSLFRSLENSIACLGKIWDLTSTQHWTLCRFVWNFPGKKEGILQQV